MTEYQKDNSQVDTLARRCRSCERVRRCIYANSNVDILQAHKKDYYNKNKNSIGLKQKVRNKSNPEKTKEKARKANLRKYQLTLAQYDDMHLKQDGRCAICRVPQCDLKYKFSVDHDHVTGKVRQLLCVKCNSVLGLSGDSVDRLQLAINYLKKHGK